MISASLRLALAATLLVTPGSWLAFARSPAPTPFAVGLALAVVLSPLVMAIEFYVLRLTGLSFEVTAVVIAAVNLPALVLMGRRFREDASPGRGSILTWLLFLALPATYLGLWMASASYRANFGHSWNHAGIVYMLANGALRPEEPQLAGVRLVYPWLGHVYQGVLSSVADMPPNAGYLFTNVTWLLAIILLVARLVARLGGDRIACASTAIVLPFGVNFAGDLLYRVLPHSLVTRYPVFGDFRYSPWLRKFGVYEQTILGIGAFAAILVVLAELDERGPSRHEVLVLGLLLLVAALMYPVLYPASIALVAGHFVFRLGRQVRAPWRAFSEGHGMIAAAAVASGLIGLAYLAVVTADHAGASTMGLSDTYSVKVKGVTSIVVLSPLLAGFAVTATRLGAAHSRTVVLLSVGAAACIALHDLVSIHHVTNEYKFIYVAAVCLTPFAVLAVARLRRSAGPLALPLMLAIGVILAYRPVIGAARDPHDTTGKPALDLGSFSLALAPAEPLAAMTDAIRSSSPGSAVLVSRATTVDLVALTRRPMYVQLDTTTETHGIGLKSNLLLKLSRGYAAERIDARRAVVREVFESNDVERQRGALQGIIRELGRPLVLVLRLPDDAPMETWLGAMPGSRILQADAHAAAWVVAEGSLGASAVVGAARPTATDVVWGGGR